MAKKKPETTPAENADAHAWADREKILKEFGRDQKFKPLRGGARNKNSVGIAPKDMTPELIRNWLHYASPQGRYEYVKAHLLALKEIPNDVRMELELIPELIKQGRNLEVSSALKDLARWHDDECIRLSLGSRTQMRTDRARKRQFMDWAASIEPKEATNLRELRALPGFKSDWASEKAFKALRRWAREAGFDLKPGRPTKNLQKK